MTDWGMALLLAALLMLVITFWSTRPRRLRLLGVFFRLDA